MNHIYLSTCIFITLFCSLGNAQDEQRDDDVKFKWVNIDGIKVWTPIITDPVAKEEHLKANLESNLRAMEFCDEFLLSNDSLAMVDEFTDFDLTVSQEQKLSKISDEYRKEKTAFASMNTEQKLDFVKKYLRLTHGTFSPKQGRIIRRASTLSGKVLSPIVLGFDRLTDDQRRQIVLEAIDVNASLKKIIAEFKSKEQLYRDRLLSICEGKLSSSQKTIFREQVNVKNVLDRITMSDMLIDTSDLGSIKGKVRAARESMRINGVDHVLNSFHAQTVEEFSGQEILDSQKQEIAKAAAEYKKETSDAKGDEDKIIELSAKFSRKIGGILTKEQLKQFAFVIPRLVSPMLLIEEIPEGPRKKIIDNATSLNKDIKKTIAEFKKKEQVQRDRILEIIQKNMTAKQVDQSGIDVSRLNSMGLVDMADDTDFDVVN